uniref:Putative lysM domain receptor-like kinase 3 n=1 Tax=Davidia involucrata TaxID=16924 RepID=A0A5B7BAN5_DAVIN
MCKTKMATEAVEPTSTSTTRSSRTSQRTTRTSTPRPPSNTSQTPRSAPTSDPSTSSGPSANYSTGSSYRLDTSRATTSTSSQTSLSSLRESLPENPHIYDFAEIRSATNNFLAKRYSSSSSPSWRCKLRGKDVIVFQRKFRRSIETSELKERLGVICRSHHSSIIKLPGASISGGHIYLVYDFVNGANLSDCLRNPRNPDFTVLSTWMSRMQIAADLADGFDYIHNNTGLSINLVHKHIKSSSIIVTEPLFNAKICHFATAELCGETAVERKEVQLLKRSGSNEITEEEEEEEVPKSRSELKRSDSRVLQFEGVRGYMSPEFQSTGIATQKSDVFAFGVVILELLSGEEPVKYKFDKTTRDYRKTSVIEMARDAIEGSATSGGGEGRLRRWVDRKLKDSFPVEVAEKITRVALECVHVDPDKRPDMRRVAGKISKLYLQSKKWSETVRVPTDFSVSFAPR